MRFQKINKLIYNISSTTYKGELFLIDKEGNYILRKTMYKGQPIEDVYRQYCELGKDDDFWNELQGIYDECNLVDKINIHHICKKLKKM